MSIVLITTGTKKWNGIYCCVIHEMKYIADILCTVIILLYNEINLYMKKCFFQTYPIAIFHVFGKLFYYYECKLRNIYKSKRFYISMMKPEAATGGVL